MNCVEIENGVSVDVSFISLKHIFPVAFAVSTEDVTGVCLVKPQFEAGREKVGKKGVVRDIAVHKEVIINVIEYAHQNGFYVKELTFSPIKGPEGNIEFLIVITKNKDDDVITEEQVDLVTEQAKQTLGE